MNSRTFFALIGWLVLWTGAARAALPDEPTLTQTQTGKSVILHFTLTGADAVPNQAFVDLVQAEADRAIKTLGKAFRKPAPEGDVGEKRLHVFIKDLGAVLAEMVSMTSPSPGGGPPRVGSYLRVNADFAQVVGTGWEAKLRDVIVHETMNGVQAAYNPGLSAWAQEAQATWAEGHFNGSYATLAAALGQAASVAKRPDLPLWDTTGAHPTSAALFIHHMVAAKGVGAVEKWLAATRGVPDGVQSLRKSLGGNGTVFAGLYRQYLGRLYQKSFKGIDPMIIPDVPEDPTIMQLGALVTGTVTPTGAIFRRVLPDDRIENTWLFASVAEATGGNPELLVLKNPARNSPIKTVKAEQFVEIPGFKAAPETLLIVTDVNPEDETAPNTTVSGAVLSPQITFTDIAAETPINEGETSDIQITYDLIGCPPTPSVLLTNRIVISKRANVIDRATEETIFFIGENKVHSLVFRTFPGTPGGLYKFTFGATVPGKSYSKKKLSTSKTSIKTEIFVNSSSAQPAAEESEAMAEIRGE